MFLVVLSHPMKSSNCVLVHYCVGCFSWIASHIQPQVDLLPRIQFPLPVDTYISWRVGGWIFLLLKIICIFVAVYLYQTEAILSPPLPPSSIHCKNQPLKLNSSIYLRWRHFSVWMWLLCLFIFMTNGRTVRYEVFSSLYFTLNKLLSTIV